MPRTVLLLATIVAVTLSAAGSQQRPLKRKIACKTPENAMSCYWVHGRLSIYNGNPTYRLWKIGTHRILGILSGPGSLKRNPDDGLEAELPDNIAFPSIGTRICGDFEVCPLQPEEPGGMQSVCTESAKNLFAKQ